MAKTYNEVSELKQKLENSVFERCSLIPSLEEEGCIVPEYLKTLLNVSSVVVKAYEHTDKLSTAQISRLNQMTNKLLKL